MKIAFNNVQSHPLKHRTRLLNRFSTVLQTGTFFHGHQNDILTKHLESHFGRGYVSVVASGHDSLLFALRSLDIKSGDEIITPANVYPTAFPVAQTGAKPVLVDVDENGLIDIEKVKRLITKRTKAIIAVHLYGLVVDIAKLKKTIANKSIKIVEDCAQAFGSTYKGRPVGSWADIGCFSFYPTKNVGTLGDGGALWTNSKRYFRFFEEAAEYGERSRYQSRFVSGHSRLPELQAAVLNVYLDTFEKERTKKKHVLEKYMSALEKSHLLKNARVLYHNNKSEPLMHLFVVEAARRKKLQEYLKNHGIPSIIHYPFPVHHVPAFKNLKYKDGDFPVTERLSAGVLSLPFHSSLKTEHIKYVVTQMKIFYEKVR